MIPNLRCYLKTWNLTEPKLLADTPTSRVYAVTCNKEKVVLKLLSPIGKIDEASGAAALKCFNGNGAVSLLKCDTKAQLLEFADGDDLAALVKKGEDEKATTIIADILNKLHYSYSGSPPVELTKLSDRFSSLVKKAGEDESKGLNSIFEKAAEVANLLIESQKDLHILHGDIHHGNIKFSTKRGWLAIDPKGIVGERAYDAANTLCNPWDMESLVEDEERLLKNASILSKRLKVDYSRLLSFTFVHACLSAIWLLEDGLDPTHALTMVKIVEPHIECI